MFYLLLVRVRPPLHLPQSFSFSTTPHYRTHQSQGEATFKTNHLFPSQEIIKIHHALNAYLLQSSQKFKPSRSSMITHMEMNSCTSSSRSIDHPFPTLPNPLTFLSAKSPSSSTSLKFSLNFWLYQKLGSPLKTLLPVQHSQVVTIFFLIPYVPLGPGLE